MGGKPSGQVVATVNGEEITASELRAEMRGFSSSDPKVMKAAQQAALQQIIVRNLLAQKAKEQKLDKTADYGLELRRGEQGLLAQTYQRKLAIDGAAGDPRPGRSLCLVAPRRLRRPQDHGGRSGDRRAEQDLSRPLQAAQHPEEVKALFSAEGVPYQGKRVVDRHPLGQPQMVEQISKLPAGEVFVVPQRNALIFNRISQVKAAPFQGDLAVNYAMNLLRNQKAQETVRQQTQALYKAAEPSVVYNAAYKPAAPAKPAASGAAPAAPAAK